MKLTDENELVLSFAQDFVQGDLSRAALEVEREGIPHALLGKMAERGYLSALIPEKLGGAALDSTSYMLLLETLAKHSPSVAFYALLQNSFVLGALSRFSGSEVEERVKSVASGKGSGAVVMDHLLSNRANSRVPLREADGGVEGVAEYVLNPGASFFLSPLARDGGDSFALIAGGGKILRDKERLGFRGIGFSALQFEQGKSRATLLAEASGDSILNETLLDASGAVAAVALGISEGAIDRAAEYAHERKAFTHNLSEYQPVAYSLTSMKGQIEILREYLYSVAGKGRREGLIAKINLTDAAISASRISMQIHGGNGYFQEYQVEKYYRDAMTLQALTGNRNRELQALAQLTLGEGSAKI